MTSASDFHFVAQLGQEVPNITDIIVNSTDALASTTETLADTVNIVANSTLSHLPLISDTVLSADESKFGAQKLWIEMALVPLPGLIACYLFSKLVDHIRNWAIDWRRRRGEARVKAVFKTQSKGCSRRIEKAARDELRTKMESKEKIQATSTDRLSPSLPVQRTKYRLSGRGDSGRKVANAESDSKDIDHNAPVDCSVSSGGSPENNKDLNVEGDGDHFDRTGRINDRRQPDISPSETSHSRAHKSINSQSGIAANGPPMSETYVSMYKRRLGQSRSGDSASHPFNSARLTGNVVMVSDSERSDLETGSAYAENEDSEDEDFEP